MESSESAETSEIADGIVPGDCGKLNKSPGGCRGLCGWRRDRDLLQEKLREVVKVLIEFSKSVLREFSIRHRDTIVEYLADSPDVRNAAQSINSTKLKHQIL